MVNTFIDLTIGTAATHVLRTGPEKPAYLAHIDRPTFLTTAGGRVYGVSEVGHGRIFQIDERADLGATSGSIPLGGLNREPLVTGIAGDVIPSGGAHPCHISASPTGGWLYVANYGDGVLRAVRLSNTGEFTETVDLTHEGSGPVTDRQTGPHAHFSQVVDDHLVIADLGTDHLRVHELTDGRPSVEARLVDMPAGSGPRHFTRIGNKLIVAGELDGTLTEVDIGTWTTGRTAPAASVPGAHYLSHIVAAHGVIIVGVRGSNTLSVLDHDLKILSEVPTANWPRHFALADQGGREGIVVAGERSDEIVWHDLLPGESTTLSEPSERLRVPTPMFIGFKDQF